MSRIISFYWSSITRFANARKVASSHPRRYLWNCFLPNSHFNKLFREINVFFAIASHIIVTARSVQGKMNTKRIEKQRQETSGMQSLGGRWWLDNHSWGASSRARLAINGFPLAYSWPSWLLAKFCIPKPRFFIINRYEEKTCLKL